MSDGLIAGVVGGIVLALIFIYVGLSTETLISQAFLSVGVVGIIFAILFGLIAVLERR